MRKEPTLGRLLRQAIPAEAFDLTIQHLNEVIESRLKEAWAERPCPFCDHHSVKTWEGCDRIHCRSCDSWLTYTYATPFYNANLAPGEILFSFVLYADSLLSINQISHLLSRPYKTTHKAVRNVETALRRGFPSVWERVQHNISGSTQIDETQVRCSGYKGGDPPRESLKRGGSGEPGRNRWSGDEGDEMTLVGACRGPLVVILAQEGASSDELEEVLTETRNLSQGLGEVHSDDWEGYKSIEGVDFIHKVVNHTEEYVSSEGIHTNRIESLWSLLQPWLRKFRGLSKHGLEQAAHTFGIVRSLNLVESPVHGVIDCLAFRSLR